MKHNRRIRRLGLLTIALWAVVLGLLNFIRLVYTFSLAADPTLAPQNRIYFYQWTTVIFGLAFFAAAWGVWQRANWGRRLFLGAVAAFFALSMAGVFSGRAAAPPPEARPWLIVRYALSIALPFAYLNLPFVKQSFQPIKETVDDR